MTTYTWAPLVQKYLDQHGLVVTEYMIRTPPGTHVWPYDPEYVRACNEDPMVFPVVIREGVRVFLYSTGSGSNRRVEKANVGALDNLWHEYSTFRLTQHPGLMYDMSYDLAQSFLAG